MQRPGSVTAAAVMCIIYGSITGLYSVCGIGSLFFEKSLRNMVRDDAMQAKMHEKLDEAAGYAVVKVTSAVLGLIVAIAFLIFGVGLLKMSDSARKLTLALCFFTMLTSVASGGYAAVVLIPAAADGVEEGMPLELAKQPGNQNAKQNQVVAQTMATVVKIGGAIVAVVFYAVLVIYLLIIVILLNRVHVRAAFAGIGPEPLDDEPWRHEKPDTGYDDDGGGERPLPPPRANPRDERIQ